MDTCVGLESASATLDRWRTYHLNGDW